MYGKMILILVMLTSSLIATHAQNASRESCQAKLAPPQAIFLDPKTTKTIQQAYKGKTYKFMRVGSQNYIMPEKYQKQGSLYYNFCPRPDDVYLVTYPKADIAWMIEVMWLIINKLDFATARKKTIEERFIFLEESMVYNKEIKQLPADSVPSPRLFKTQLPFSLIPKIRDSANKIIFFARNPKDVILSSFDYVRVVKTWAFIGDIKQYWYFFQNNLTMYSPYWSHTKEGLSQNKNKKVLILYAEEDELVLFKKVSAFLGKKYTNNQLKSAVKFMNKKKIPKETWKGVFPKDLNKNVNDWIKLYIDDIKFPNINIYS